MNFQNTALQVMMNLHLALLLAKEFNSLTNCLKNPNFVHKSLRLRYLLSSYQSHSLYINFLEKNILEFFFYCSENKIPLCSYVYTQTKERFTVYTLKYLILSVTKTLLTLCTANRRIPLKCARSHLPSTAALSRSRTKAPGVSSPATQKQVSS